MEIDLSDPPRRIVWGGRGAQSNGRQVDAPDKNEQKRPHFLIIFYSLFNHSPVYLLTCPPKKMTISHTAYYAISTWIDRKNITKMYNFRRFLLISGTCFNHVFATLGYIFWLVLFDLSYFFLTCPTWKTDPKCGRKAWDLHAKRTEDKCIPGPRNRWKPIQKHGREAEEMPRDQVKEMEKVRNASRKVF